MRGGTPSESVGALLETLQRAMSCISDDVLRPERGGYVPGGTLSIDLPHGLVRLRAQPPFSLRVEHYYRIEHDADRSSMWRAATVGYVYGLYREDGREILAYHWHPDGRSHVTTPHLHLGGGAEVGWAGLQKTHLPSGSILLPDLMELAIGAGARPRRADWQTVVNDTRAELTAG